jgi:hypothetical protein
MAYKVITNLFPNFEFASMVIFRCKNICEISTENYILCSFELEKYPIFRICAIRMDLRVKSDIYFYPKNILIFLFNHLGCYRIVIKILLKVKFDIFSMENLSNFNFNLILMTIRKHPQ